MSDTMEDLIIAAIRDHENLVIVTERTNFDTIDVVTAFSLPVIPKHTEIIFDMVGSRWIHLTRHKGIEDAITKAIAECKVVMPPTKLEGCVRTVYRHK